MPRLNRKTPENVVLFIGQGLKSLELIRMDLCELDEFKKRLKKKKSDKWDV